MASNQSLSFLSSLSDDDTTNSITTHDIPQSSVEYDMDYLSNTNDLDGEDCGRNTNHIV